MNPKTGTENPKVSSTTAPAEEAPVGEFANPDFELKMVQFPFNSDEITEESMSVLRDNAAWMVNFPENKVVLEGHCDNRGSTQYNLSLGERRANAVKRFLSTLGVNPDNLDILSYGEEKPLIDEETENAYSSNRRVEFRKRR